MTIAFARQRRMACLIALMGALLLSGCDFKPFQISELSERSESELAFETIDRAEAIADPVQRCIEYPSPPQVQWSKSMIETFCHDVFMEVPQAVTVKAMIDQKDWKGLQAYYDGYLARHLAGEDPEAVLYRVFPANSWRDEDEADRYSRRWLQARPEDAYANTLRAKHLIRRAWVVRGSGFASEISTENMRKTIALAREASVLLTRAVKAEPRLMPAYQTLIEAYMLGERPELMRRALQVASQQSPSNYYVREEAGDYLRLIWGGTPAELDALADDARRHLDRNPRLSLLLANNTTQLGHARYRGKRYGRALAAARDALESGPDYSALQLGADASERVGYETETIVYLSQIIRFNRGPKDELMRRGLLFEANRFYAYALRDYRAALAITPDDSKIRERIAETERKAKSAQQRRRSQ
jgi:tetratricopeptide (TPR) repeat protein